MARRVFFSFHYERDIWRANVVRNSWLLQRDRAAAGFWDASLWEEAKGKGRRAIEEMINDALYNTSVTVVLIGHETSEREYVRYEIVESHLRGKGLLGVHIHNIANNRREVDYKGTNPFSEIYDVENKTYLSRWYRAYDWVRDDGYSNIGFWVEEAARAAGR